jgi:hypothetical protein
MNARVLFTVAATFNFIVGLGILLCYGLLAPRLGFPPQPTVWIHIIALVVLVFGYAYGRVAMDPVRFREFVQLGIIGKLAFVLAIYAHFLNGSATGALAILVTADLVFAVLFGAYLKGSRT